MGVFARFAPRLQEAIVARLGWTALRPVQEEAGEALLDGCNAVVLAPTAGGKTEAAMFPALSGLVRDEPRGVGVIYVAPIKALLNNQSERLAKYADMVGLRRFVWHGDVGTSDRARFLRDPVALLMTTPESLEVMLVSERVDEQALFGDLRMVVVDEIHAMAGTDRGAHLMSVIERLAALSRHDVQRVGLSATVGNPDAILGWLQGTSARPGRVVNPKAPPSKRQILVVHRPEPADLAADAANVARGHKSLFFCQSRRMTEAVADRVKAAGVPVFVHHGSLSYEERALAEDQFAHGQEACIVATSTLELGIDVGDLDKVLQAEAPDTVGSFLQRMGRTGRRPGQTANTTFFCESPWSVVQALALVELARAGWVEDVEVRGRCWPVLVHQLLVLALADGGIPADAAWAHLCKVPDFAGIHRAEFDRLVAWMLRDRSLVLATGRLLLGPKVERLFGRKNFMALYAVFSSPQSYRVVTAQGQPLGSLQQDFVDRLVDGVSSFLLGGRAWWVVDVDHTDRVVKVERAPAGREPTWAGYTPSFLGFAVCQQMRALLAGDQPFASLHPTAAAALAAMREGLREALDHDGLEFDGREVRWWTFAGGRVNGTLKHGLLAVGGDWEVVTDNLCIKVRGEDLDPTEVRAATGRLADAEVWEDPKVWQGVAEGLPNYRLTKFQPLLPPWIERELVATFLLDVRGAWSFAGGRPDEVARLPAALWEGLRGPEPEAPGPLDVRVPVRPVRWIDDTAELERACEVLRRLEVVGLDVETTLDTRALCLVQLGTADETLLVDPFEVDLEPLAGLMADERVTKVIHNAAFEKSVLARHGIEIRNVFDTLAVSRAVRGKRPEGHSLARVCERELGVFLDKGQQKSDWSARPLSDEQRAYAAVDAEVLVELREVFAPLVAQPGLFERE